MRKTLIAALLGMAGCAGAAQRPTAPITHASADNGRSCILAASDLLAQRGLTAVDSRVMPLPADQQVDLDGLIGQQVELDVKNAGLTQTYVYACVTGSNRSFASLAGIR